jgi:hypothetical protein
VLSEVFCERVEATRTLGPLLPPLRLRHGSVKDEIREPLPQGAVRWSANCEQKYRNQFRSSRTGCLSARPAITSFWRPPGLFVESDYPPPT